MDIKTFRQKYKLSREDLASKVGVSGQTIYRWEKGVNPTNKIIKEKLVKVMKEYKNVSNAF